MLRENNNIMMHDHQEQDGDLTSLAAEVCGDSGTVSTANNTNAQSCTPPRPILVGYAFGPKKMSTMGIIMAEASQALPTVIPVPAAVAVPVHSMVDREEDHQCHGQRLMEGKTSKQMKRKFATEDTISTLSSSFEPPIATKTESPSAAATFAMKKCGQVPYTVTSPLGFKSSGSSASAKESYEWLGNNSTMQQDFDKMMFRSIGQKRPNSSAASIADSTTTVTTSTMPLTASSNSSLCRVASQDGNGNCRMYPVRVSFVPLDMDSPLEEQHGGKFDAILHKLTEDILSLSKMSYDAPNLKRLAESNNGGGCSTEGNLSKESFKSIVGLNPDDSQTQAVQRVNRLNQYKLNHPECCLVDHPSSVQVLMSRSDIAHVLSKCLVGINTISGIRVRSPRFELVESENVGRKLLSKLVQQAPFGYPIMVKPLIAAGTAESHKMAVVLGPSGLARVKTPCLLQEYANHDATLYKVYVLGDIVRVFSRPSLPNLPPMNNSSKMPCHRTYIEFDSQRPYPELSDFGITTEVNTSEEDESASNCVTDAIRLVENEMQSNDCERSSKRPRTTSSGRRGDNTTTYDQKILSSQSTRSNKISVTADEILPVVEALKKAFSLELFGFDILVTHRARGIRSTQQAPSKEEEMEMVVVDVNYFPSYKEVSSFPSMLAQFLTQRAVEGRGTI